MTSILRRTLPALLAASVAPLSWAADFSSEPYLLRLFLGLDQIGRAHV